MRPEENSKRFKISNRFEKMFRLHENFTTGNLKPLSKMRPEENSKRFDISNRFEKLFHLHGNFTTAFFQTIIRFYCARANYSF